MDEAHCAYSFKYLKNKPVKELNGDQFLKMCLAEEEGLLAIDICIDLVGVKGYSCVLNKLAWDQDLYLLIKYCIQEIQSSSVYDLYRFGDQTYFDEIKQFYYRDEFSHQVQEWNKQRTLAIERSLQHFLYPQMAKELKNKLVAEAKDNIIKVPH